MIINQNTTSKPLPLLVSDKDMQNQAGFSLVEVAIAMICIGLLLSGTLLITNAISEARKQYDTKAKMAVIADHLSFYAQTHNRLPCPASPIRDNYSSGAVNRAAYFGDERKFVGSANDINRAADCFSNTTDSHGIVPYRTLGLTEDFATDAWGRYFTYVVSPVSARYNYLNPADTTLNLNVVHNVTSTQEEALAPKLRFCHGMTNIPQSGGAGAPAPSNSAADDIQFSSLIGIAAPTFPYARGEQQETVLAANIPDRLFANDYQQGTLGTDNPHTIRPAYALISHGDNGFGAYYGNETINKKPLVGIRTSEAANARDGIAAGVANSVFLIDYADGAGAAAAALFDDIVLMETQDQVFARKGGQSCVTP
jgi:type II secretory pathway pseudopilin PulG